MDLNCLENFSIVMSVDAVKTDDIVDTGFYDVVNKANNVLSPETDFLLNPQAEIINILSCSENVNISINPSKEKAGIKYSFKLTNTNKLDNEHISISPQMMAKLNRDTYSILLRYMNGKTGLVYAPEGCFSYSSDTKDDTIETTIEIQNFSGLQIIDN